LRFYKNSYLIPENKNCEKKVKKKIIQPLIFLKIVYWFINEVFKKLIFVKLDKVLVFRYLFLTF